MSIMTTMMMSMTKTMMTIIGTAIMIAFPL